MPQASSAYLDIETSYQGHITVVGVHRPGRPTRQLVAPDIEAGGLFDAIGEAEVIKTYNGSRFDLPVIRLQLGVDLASLYRHEDLMFRCWRRGLKGGLKAVERRLGILRATAGVDGMEAMRLWQAWIAQGSREALERLLHYNREDVELLVEVEKRLAAHG